MRSLSLARPALNYVHYTYSGKFALPFSGCVDRALVGVVYIRILGWQTAVERRAKRDLLRRVARSYLGSRRDPGNQLNEER